MWDDYEVRVASNVIGERAPVNWKVSGLVTQFKAAVSGRTDDHSRVYGDPNGGGDLVVTVSHGDKIISISRAGDDIA